MSHSIKLNKGLLAAMSAATLLVTSQGVFAHTRLETPTVLEGTRVHNQVVISHGCTDPSGAVSSSGSSVVNQPTWGTTVVFPNAVSYTPIIGVDGTSGAGTAKVYTTNAASTYYSPLSGIGAIIRTGGPWAALQNKVDALNNKDGFWAGGAFYDQSISTAVDVPFYSAAITIAAASCARSVTFELAIADVCNPKATSPNIGDSDVLFWSPIPNFTGVPGQPFGAGVADATRSIPVGPKYSNYDGWSNGNKVGMGTATAIAGDGWGSPATLKVTRNLTTNPLPAGCKGNGGLGDDVFVYPSAAQINAELPAWSGANQTGTNFWK